MGDMDRPTKIGAKRFGLEEIERVEKTGFIKPQKLIPGSVRKMIGNGI